MTRALALALAALLASAPSLRAGTNLSKAAIDGDRLLVRARLEGGEKVNDVDTWGWTALLWASYYGHAPVVEFLLKQGADPNMVTVKEYGNFKPGASALILASYYGYTEIVQALVTAKADRSVKDAAGKTALDYAREFKFAPCVEILSR